MRNRYMPNCELCGKEAVLFRANVEGTEIEVCKTCGSFGKVLTPKGQQASMKQVELPKELQLTEVVTKDFSALVKRAREKKSLTQEEFAKQVREKESIIHKIETGALEPPIPLARKLEKALNIRLVENVEEEQIPQAKKSTGPITIGDIIKRK